MTDESGPEAVVSEHMDAYNDGDVDRFVDTFTEDAVIAGLGAEVEEFAVGHGEIREEYGPLFENNPSLRCAVESRIAVENTVVLHERLHLPDRDLSSGIAIYRVEDGRIGRLWLSNE